MTCDCCFVGLTSLLERFQWRPSRDGIEEENVRLPLPRIEHPKPHDMPALFQRGEPLILRGLLKPRLDRIVEQEDDFEMFVPRGKMNANHLPTTVKWQELRKNLKEAKATSPVLNDLDCFFSSEKLKARFEAYRTTPVYATVNTGSIAIEVAHHLDHSYANASHLCDYWTQRMGYFWVGASTGSLHYDEFDNLLCQIAGRKKVILIPFEHSFAFKLGSIRSVFPNHSDMNANFFTEEMRVANPWLQKVPYFQADLFPGDTLLIPAGMLHAPCGDLDSISANIFVMDGPSPCRRSWWLLKRLAISTAVRSFLHAKTAHHDYHRRKSQDIEKMKTIKPNKDEHEEAAKQRHSRAVRALGIDHKDLGREQGHSRTVEPPMRKSQTEPSVKHRARHHHHHHHAEHEHKSPDQLFMCTVEVDVESKDRDKLLEVMGELSALTKVEPGCLRYEFLQVQDEPNRFCLFEVWHSVADLENHKRTDHFAKLTPQIFAIAKCRVTKHQHVVF